jgi:hypothetical protein
MKYPFFAVSAVFVLTASLQASTLVENFESYVSPLGSTMNGLGGWTVSNGVTSDPGAPFGAVASLEPAFLLPAFGGTQSATVGGWAQTSLGLTSMSYNGLSVPIVNSFNPAVGSSFSIDVQMGAANLSTNPFSIVLNANSGNLLTIDFVQSSGSVFDLSWSSGLDAVAGPTPFATLLSGIATTFRLDLFASGPSDVGFTFANGTGPGAYNVSGLLTGAAQTDTINGLSINWDSQTSAGDSFMSVDNISVIPEPSSALLCMLGASFAFLRRRRA